MVMLLLDGCAAQYKAIRPCWDGKLLCSTLTLKTGDIVTRSCYFHLAQGRDATDIERTINVQQHQILETLSRSSWFFFYLSLVHASHFCSSIPFKSILMKSHING